MNTTQAFCPQCARNLNTNELAFLLGKGEPAVYCEECGFRMIHKDLVILPTNSAKVRIASHSLTDFTWFHATTVENWFEKVSEADACVHVGEMDTSLDIALSDWALDNDKSNCKPFFMYELSFKDSAVQYPRVMRDCDNDDLFSKGFASWYINRWESPGSVSVYTPAHFLNVVHMDVLTWNEWSKMETLYTTVCIPKVA